MSDTTMRPADEFLRTYYDDAIGELAQNYPREQRSLHVDWYDLYRYDAELADDLLDDPEDVLRRLEEALRMRGKDLPININLGGANVRVTNLPNEDGPGNVARQYNLNRLVGVTGQVAKVSAVKPKCEEGAFRCLRCESLNSVDQHGDELTEPHECRSCERQGPFRLDRGQSRFVDHQAARVQQPPEKTHGGNAQHIDVHLEGDIINEFQAGDRVTVSGILELDASTMESRVMDTELRGNAVELEESTYEDIEVDEHVDEIRALASGERGDPYELVRESIHPTHSGDDDIKLAIALQLFGGWAREFPDGSRRRGDSHVLLLGDPGCGKSSLLKAVADLAPKSQYASGKGATASGLTAAAVRDDFGDTEWGLEAGALVLADGGVACVDEIDKMEDSAVSSMHEALESQQVNVNKAGINATLNARTSLLAAGNPKYGRFDKYEPFGEQIDMDPALISRFDLLFMVTDDPDEEEDREVVGEMIESNRTGAKYTLGEELSEAERESIEPPISREVLRAYIAYAKERVFPRIRDDDVKEALQQYFVGLRQANGSQDASDENPVPVTYRKEQAIERLAEASARVRLSETVEHEDVERAVHLVEKSLRQVGRDSETGQFDADVIETGTTTSQRSRIKRIANEVQERGGVTLDELDEALEDVGRGLIEKELEKLAESGDIYNLGDGSDEWRWA